MSLEPLAPASPELLKQAKLHIRKRMRAMRQSFSEKSLAHRSQLIVERTLEELLRVGARSVASFWPMVDRGEVDLRPLDTALRERSITLHYPFMTPRPQGGMTTGFARTESAGDLADRGRGFLEPPPDNPSQPGQIDVVLVPALAADARGMRIGYGAGYYDATLGDVCPPAVAWIVAYDFQLMAELPAEPHDLACQRVITDERLIESQ